MTQLTSTRELVPEVLAPVSQDTIDQSVEFLSKGYTDEDCLHILPSLTIETLEEIKQGNSATILRGMRDYYLVGRMNDDIMDRLEMLALEKLELSMALEADPMKILKIFQTLNTAKRRSQGEGQVAGNTTIIQEQKIVQINMPVRMISHDPQDYETNSRNEVIRVGDTHMVTATNTQVLAQLKRHQADMLQEAYDGI